MKVITWFGMLLLLSPLLLGCQGFDKYLRIPQDGGTSPEYRLALKKWSRDGAIHSGFETKAIVHSTHIGKEFSETLAAERRRIYDEPPVPDRVPATARAGEKTLEFVCYISTPSSEAQNLDKTDSPWRVYLLAGDKRITPRKIERTPFITPELEELYPYVEGRFGVLYSLSFPLAAAEVTSGPLRLVFTGPLGKLELVW